MNEIEVKELFAAISADPAPDRIDMVAVLRGGRRRHRTRVAATLGACFVALTLVTVMLSGVLPGSTPTAGGPSPTGTAPMAPNPVTSVGSLVGAWNLTDAPRDSDGIVPGVTSTLIFAADGTWQAFGRYWCLPRGTFSVDGDGRFTAVETEPNLVACPRSQPDITKAVQLTVDGEAPGSRSLTMRKSDGGVLAVWSSTPAPSGR